MFVFLWSNVSEKEKKKSQDLYRFSCFSLGLGIYEMTHFCIFTALKADMLVLFSKDMLRIPCPPSPMLDA